jgi:hypothetical protein
MLSKNEFLCLFMLMSAYAIFTSTLIRVIYPSVPIPELAHNTLLLICSGVLAVLLTPALRVLVF